jgi:hypothetical protein
LKAENGAVLGHFAGRLAALLPMEGGRKGQFTQPQNSDLLLTWQGW